MRDFLFPKHQLDRARAETIGLRAERLNPQAQPLFAVLGHLKGHLETLRRRHRAAQQPAVAQRQPAPRDLHSRARRPHRPAFQIERAARKAKGRRGLRAEMQPLDRPARNRQHRPVRQLQRKGFAIRARHSAEEPVTARQLQRRGRTGRLVAWKLRRLDHVDFFLRYTHAHLLHRRRHLHRHRLHDLRHARGTRNIHGHALRHGLANDPAQPTGHVPNHRADIDLHVGHDHPPPCGIVVLHARREHHPQYPVPRETQRLARIGPLPHHLAFRQLHQLAAQLPSVMENERMIKAGNLRPRLPPALVLAPRETTADIDLPHDLIAEKIRLRRQPELRAEGGG